MKIATGASLVLAASLMLGACAKHDDAGNTTVTNETVVNETVVSETGDNGAATANLASPDTSANATDLGNSTGGNGL